MSKNQGVDPGGRFDQVHLFVGEGAQPGAKRQRRWECWKGGLLWACYPKGGKADINRDRGWEPLHEAGWHQVTQVAIDDTLSALRFPPLADNGH
jgi:hypothetical protein